jgi:chromosome segregation ATPase
MAFRFRFTSPCRLQKVAALKDDLQEMTDLYEARSQDIHAHRARQEELARHVEDLVDELNREQETRERAEADLKSANKEHDAALRRERRSMEGKESALQSSLDDLSRTKELLTQRESDLAAVQSALEAIERESKKAGETHTTAKFSLQLEVDRLKRDLERLEDDLARARKDVDDRDAKNRDRDGALDKLHAENRDLASQLAAQTQARLNMGEKLDGVQGSLRSAESELAVFKMRVADLEQRLSKDQRSLLAAESQYRDQLTERNTLLLTIYQYMDKILGVDKTPVSTPLFCVLVQSPIHLHFFLFYQKKGGQAETKPFTNFSVFHDNLITRLKALSQIQLDFDKRCKDVEKNFTEKLGEMKKMLEHRWKQIDKFEASVKAYAETKASWRRKFNAKEGELEAVKVNSLALYRELFRINEHSDPRPPTRIWPRNWLA